MQLNGIVHPPQPDDLRLEVNVVPGTGNLDGSVALPLPAVTQRRLSVR